MFKSTSSRVTSPPLHFLLTTKNLINFYAIFTSRFYLVVVLSSAALFPSTIKNAFLSQKLIFNYELALFAESQHVWMSLSCVVVQWFNWKSCLENMHDVLLLFRAVGGTHFREYVRANIDEEEDGNEFMVIAFKCTTLFFNESSLFMRRLTSHYITIINLTVNEHRIMP